MILSSWQWWRVTWRCADDDVVDNNDDDDDGDDDDTEIHQVEKVYWRFSWTWD